MNQINVDVKLEMRDFTRFTNYFIKNKFLDGILKYGSLFIIILSFMFISEGKGFGVIIQKPVLLLFILAALVWIYLEVYSFRYFQIKGLFENERLLGRNTNYTFSNDGIKAVSDSAEINLKWAEIYRVIIKPRKVLICLSAYKKLLIPTRVFKNEEELKKLIELFGANFNNTSLIIKK